MGDLAQDTKNMWTMRDEGILLLQETLRYLGKLASWCGQILGCSGGVVECWLEFSGGCLVVLVCGDNRFVAWSRGQKMAC